MKKRTASGARGYLSQMAEPVLAGEPTLRVRHRAHGWDAQNMSAVPQEIVETHRPKASHAMQGEDNRSVKREAPGMMDARERIDRQRQINSVAGIDAVHGVTAPQQEFQKSENIAPQNVSRPLLAQAQKKLDSIGKLATENSGEEPGRAQKFRPVVSHNAVADDADASHPVKFERRDVVQEQNLTPAATDAALHSPTPLREKLIREQRSEEQSVAQSEAQPTLLSETRSLMKAWAKNPMEAIAESHEPKPMLNQNLQQQKSGTSIHIGTIEVRTVVHRPEPVAPAASPAVMSQPPAAPAGSLARSFNWRYGLVQG